MAVVARYLVDTSATARATHTEVAQRLVPLIEAGLVGTCAALDLEALYSARSVQEYRRIEEDRRLAYEYLPTGDEDWRRAVDVQARLAATGRWRAAGIADLVIAAVAERHGVRVLHYDADFDAIASVTDQSTSWVVARGSVP